MMTRVAAATILSCVIFLAPLAARPALFAHPAPWLGIVTALVVLLSQPPVDLRESASRSGDDRGSAIAIFAAMLAAQVGAAIEFGLRGRPEVGPAVAVGTLLVMAGLVLRLAAIRTLGRFFTSIVRVTGDQLVVQTGPYRWLRHPSYTGALLAAVGVTLALESRVGLVLVGVTCIPAYLYRIRQEESALSSALGPSYAVYRNRTWGLFPGVR